MTTALVIQVRNAIKRIKEKRKALSFTVSDVNKQQSSLHHCSGKRCLLLLCGGGASVTLLCCPFKNCSQPTSFLPSQGAPATTWVCSPLTHVSQETSETSRPSSSTSTSLVIKNGGPNQSINGASVPRREWKVIGININDQ